MCLWLERACAHAGVCPAGEDVSPGWPVSLLPMSMCTHTPTFGSACVTAGGAVPMRASGRDGPGVAVFVWTAVRTLLGSVCLHCRRSFSRAARPGALLCVSVCVCVCACVALRVCSSCVGVCSCGVLPCLHVKL